MFERPFGAMNGCLGTLWPTVGSGVAGEPMNVGTSVARGSWGMGGGVSPGDWPRATPAGPSATSAAAAIATPLPLIRGQISALSPRAAAGPPGWKNDLDAGAKAPGADPGAQSAHQHLDARVPGRRPSRARLLQRSRRGYARPPLRGRRADEPRGVDRRLRSVRRGRQADGARRSPHHACDQERPPGPRAVPDPLRDRRRVRDRVERRPDRGLRGGLLGGDDLLLARRRRPDRGTVKLKVWGARGSVPAPGPEMNRYGGNTSCVQLTLDSGAQLILDAGTGIRNLGLDRTVTAKVSILLTHLHLDHIQGLMFFPPCFRSDAEITIWGPASPEASLEDRIARYISAPLSPVEIRELPCSVSFHDTPPSEWRIGSATIRCESVNHRGPTLGFRVSEGDTTVCYIPDHEPGLGTRLASVGPEWISGFDLAREADLLIHDCQDRVARLAQLLGLEPDLLPVTPEAAEEPAHLLQSSVDAGVGHLPRVLPHDLVVEVAEHPFE